MGGQRLRFRSLLGRGFWVALAACVLVTVVGGALAYDAYSERQPEQTVRTVTDGSVQGAFTHRSTITDRAVGTPFEPNATVRNRGVYFERLMPVLEGTFALSYTDADTPAVVAVRRAVVLESVGETDDETVVYWRQNRSVTTVERAVDPGGEVTVPFRVNVTAARQAAERIDERIGSPGDTRIRVVTTVTATKPEPEPRTVRQTFVLSLDGDGSVYRPTADTESVSFSRTVTETVPNEPGPLRSVGGPLLVVGGLVGAGGLGVLFVRGEVPVSEAEREWLAYRDDRTDFAEWIHTVTLPDAVVDDLAGEAETLADLVDFAIDADAAVVEDPERDAYFAVREGRTFAYDPPETPAAVDDVDRSADADDEDTGLPDDPADGDAAEAVADDVDEDSDAGRGD